MVFDLLRSLLEWTWTSDVPNQNFFLYPNLFLCRIFFSVIYVVNMIEVYMIIGLTVFLEPSTCVNSLRANIFCVENASIWTLALDFSKNLQVRSTDLSIALLNEENNKWRWCVRAKCMVWWLACNVKSSCELSVHSKILFRIFGTFNSNFKKSKN